MKNPYIESMRQAIVALWNTATHIAEEYAAKKQDLSDMRMAEQRSAANEGIQAAVVTANNALDAVMVDVTGRVKRWSTVDSSKMDSSDIALMNSGYHLTKDDVYQLICKHADNYMMLSFIEQRIRDRKLPFSYQINEKLSASLPDEKIGAYKALFDTAKSLVASIAAFDVDRFSVMLGTEYRARMEARYTEFGTEYRAGQVRNLETCGDGHELKEYNIID